MESYEGQLAPNVELDHNLSVMERIRNSHFGMKVTALAASLTMITSASEGLINPEPVNADLASSASRNKKPHLTGITKVCVTAGLNSSRVVQAKLDNPGAFGQGYVIREYFEDVAAGGEDVPATERKKACDDVAKRVVKIRPEMQNPYNHKQWINKEKPRWRVFYARNEGGPGAAIILNHEVRATSYRPTPGPGVTHARFKELIVMKDPKNNHILGQALKIYPVHIEGGAR